MFISRSCSDGEMLAETDGGGLFSVSLKCSVHFCPPYLSRADLDFLFFPEKTRVISYSLFIILWPAAVSASPVMPSWFFCLF